MNCVADLSKNFRKIAQTRQTFLRMGTRKNRHGGWMTHSFFIVQRSNATTEGVPLTAYAAYSFGNASQTNPTPGGARWVGVMVGIHKEEGNTIQGVAEIELDMRDEPAQNHAAKRKHDQGNAKVVTGVVFMILLFVLPYPETTHPRVAIDALLRITGVVNSCRIPEHARFPCLPHLSFHESHQQARHYRHRSPRKLKSDRFYHWRNHVAPFPHLD